MKKIVAIALTLIVALACGWLIILIRNISHTASQVSAEYSEAFGTLSPLQTAAAYQIPTRVSEEALSVVATRRVFELDGWFAFTDGTVDGQPAVIAKLTAEGEKHYPGFGNSFAGIFIGDPANLTQIRFTVLRTEPRAPEMYSDSCMLIERVLVIDVLPFTYEEKSTFTDWMQEKCRTVPLGNAEQTMIKNIQFVFERSKTNYINLVVTPQR